MTEERNTGLAVVEQGSSLPEMASRLADMKNRLDLVRQFFREVMVEGEDYGVIPGTEKPTLLKPGSEKLCEFYGYAITIKDEKSTKDRQTGFCEYVITVALVSRKTGEVVAEGVGSANTNESRYRWRWTPEWKLPKGIDKSSLYSEERTSKKGQTFRMYRLENDDPWTLWNTVLKMAKKRALIDACLSATRSSGLFTQDMEDLKEWAESGPVFDAEYSHTDDGSPSKGQQSEQPKPSEPQKANGQSKASAKNGSGSRVPPADESKREEYLGQVGHVLQTEDYGNLTSAEIARFITHLTGEHPSKAPIDKVAALAHVCHYVPKDKKAAAKLDELLDEWRQTEHKAQSDQKAGEPQYDDVPFAGEPEQPSLSEVGS